MRIIHFQAENIKKLKVVEIDTKGQPVISITGPNGAGKSSVLDAIAYALAGGKAIDSQPVRKGQDSATVRLTIGDLIVTRLFTEDGKSTLTVSAADGAAYKKPQAMLDALVGKLTFDPLAFSRMEPKEQLNALKKVVTLDTDIDKLDMQYQSNYDLRREVNRTVDALDAEVKAVRVPSDLPAEPIDLSVLQSQVNNAGEANTVIATKAANRKQMAALAASKKEEAAELRRRADALCAEAQASEDKLAGAGPLPPMVDTSALMAQIEAARLVNDGIKLRVARETLAARLKKATIESMELTADMDSLTATKAAAIGRAKMPVAGLGFGDGMVLLNGLPFEQASSAEQLRVSVGIAMAGNPELRILMVRDGGLLDEDSLALLTQMAETHDYQVWIETAGTHRPGIVMEDGMVKSDVKASAKAGKP